MKKFFAMLLALTMALSLAACGGGDAAGMSASNTADDGETVISTVTPGKLTVATSPDFAPYEFYAIDESGSAQLAGFDMALAQYIADYLGLELEVVPMGFDGVLSEINAGSVDLAVAGLSPEPDRMDAMDFSDSYYTTEDGSGQVVVVNEANKDKWATLEEMNDPAVTVGAQLGSLQYGLAVANTPDADIVTLEKVTDIISEILGGKLDAGYIEGIAAESYQQNYPELYIAFPVDSGDNTGSCVGVVKGNEALLAGVNEAIAAALADGSMDAFVAEATELANGNIYEGLMEG